MGCIKSCLKEMLSVPFLSWSWIYWWCYPQKGTKKTAGVKRARLLPNNMEVCSISPLTMRFSYIYIVYIYVHGKNVHFIYHAFRYSSTYTDSVLLIFITLVPRNPYYRANTYWPVETQWAFKHAESIHVVCSSLIQSTAHSCFSNTRGRQKKGGRSKAFLQSQGLSKRVNITR